MAGQRSVSSNTFAQGANQNSGNVLTDRPSTAVLAPPGGKSQICFGDMPEVQNPKAVSSNSFATGTNQNCGNILTNRSSTGIHAPPGGKSSICLGMTDADVSDAKGVSSNRFASGANQNSGNILTGRSSTGINAPPGGKSSICLGMTDPAVPGSGVSSNRFASGANQNSGNILTDRSSTGINAPPGGKSSICLGMSSPEVSDMKARNRCTCSVADAGDASKPQSVSPPGGKSGTETAKPKTLSSNAFAQGSNQNCGNILTDRPSTGILAPPGGKSSICLGMEPQAAPMKAKNQGGYCSMAMSEPTPARAPARPARATAGGNSSIVLG